jgi:hypothetical protein
MPRREDAKIFFAPSRLCVKTFDKQNSYHLFYDQLRPRRRICLKYAAEDGGLSITKWLNL